MFLRGGARSLRRGWCFVDTGPGRISAIENQRQRTTGTGGYRVGTTLVCQIGSTDICSKADSIKPSHGERLTKLSVHSGVRGEPPSNVPMILFTKSMPPSNWALS
jgi:hypothetical protein